MLRDFKFTESMVDKMQFGECLDLLISVEESVKRREEKKEKPNEPLSRLSELVNM